MCLIDSYAAGSEVLQQLENAFGGFEWLIRKMVEESPERAGMPQDMISASIGALKEIASTRLRRGTEAELPGLVKDIWDLIGIYRPPPEPLRFATRLHKPTPETLEPRKAAERALRAFAVVAAEEGYPNLTVNQVVKRASMSARTFYSNFAGKEGALLAAIDSGVASLVAVVLPAYRRAPDWPSGMRAAFGALFTYLASRPALARLLAVEKVYAAGSAALDLRSECMRPLEVLFEPGYQKPPPKPPVSRQRSSRARFMSSPIGGSSAAPSTPFPPWLRSVHI